MISVEAIKLGGVYCRYKLNSQLNMLLANILHGYMSNPVIQRDCDVCIPI
jgi:hypothetical protein